MYYNDELYHYGVKGMKWGVRKSIAKKARTYSTLSELSRVNKKTLNRLEKRKKVNGYLSDRQEKVLDRSKKYQENLDKAMKTLVKDISEKDIKQAKVDNLLRDFGAAFIAGGIGVGVSKGIRTAKAQEAIYDLLDKN